MVWMPRFELYTSNDFFLVGIYNAAFYDSRYTYINKENTRSRIKKILIYYSSYEL